MNEPFEPYNQIRAISTAAINRFLALSQETRVTDADGTVRIVRPALSPRDNSVFLASFVETVLRQRTTVHVHLASLAADAYAVDEAAPWQTKRVGQSLKKMDRLGVLTYQPWRGRRPTNGPGGKSLVSLSVQSDASSGDHSEGENGSLKGVGNGSLLRRSEKDASCSPPLQKENTNQKGAGGRGALEGAVVALAVRSGAAAADVAVVAKRVALLIERVVGRENLGPIVEHIAATSSYTWRGGPHLLHRLAKADVIPNVTDWPTDAGEMIDALMPGTLASRLAEASAKPWQDVAAEAARVTGWAYEYLDDVCFDRLDRLLYDIEQEVRAGKIITNAPRYAAVAIDRLAKENGVTMPPLPVAA